jgi:Tetratricopeptide repeat
VAHVLQGLGDVARGEGDYPRARALKEEGLLLLRELGDKACTASTLAGLGMLAHLEADDERARALLEQSLALGRELDDRGTMALALEGVAAVLGEQTAFDRAARLLGAAEALREAGSAPQMPYERSALERTVRAVRGGMGVDSCARRWAEGRALSLDQVLEQAVEPAPAWIGTRVGQAAEHHSHAGYV